MQRVGKQEFWQDKDLRDEKSRTQARGRSPSAILDQILARWCKDETRFEKPLRVVFLSFLCLTVAVLTLQNVVTEYRTLSEPQDLIVRTTERLLMHQRALAKQTPRPGSQCRQRRHGSADSHPQKKDTANIKAVADRVFAGKAADLNIAELTIYSADQQIVYRAQSNATPAQDSASFETN